MSIKLNYRSHFENYQEIRDEDSRKMEQEAAGLPVSRWPLLLQRELWQRDRGWGIDQFLKGSWND